MVLFKQGCVTRLLIILMELVLRNAANATRELIKWECITLLDLDYAHGLTILYKNVDEINEYLKALRFLGAKIILKIDFNERESLILGIGENE